MSNIFADRMHSVHKSFIREILKVTEDPEIISFAGGLPNPSFFPVKEVADAAQKVLCTCGEEALQIHDVRSMGRDSLNFLADDTIGIIGCGHLGKAIAEELIDRGFSKEKLLISYGGSASTHESIRRAGLLDNLSDNAEICNKSSVIFLTVRPQSFEVLKGLSFPKNSLIVSCMASVPLASLKEALGIDIVRIMPSGPDIMRKGKGIAAVYPQNKAVIDILSGMGLKVYVLPEEDLMHIFTVGVCLPAALLVAEEDKLDIGRGVDAIQEEYPEFGEIYIWAKSILPKFNSDDQRKEYVKRMSTKGGITEAIVDCLNSGGSLQDALRRGIARSKEISEKLRLTSASNPLE